MYFQALLNYRYDKARVYFQALFFCMMLLMSVNCVVVGNDGEDIFSSLGAKSASSKVLSKPIKQADDIFDDPLNENGI